MKKNSEKLFFYYNSSAENSNFLNFYKNSVVQILAKYPIYEIKKIKIF